MDHISDSPGSGSQTSRKLSSKPNAKMACSRLISFAVIVETSGLNKKGGFKLASFLATTLVYSGSLARKVSSTRSKVASRMCPLFAAFGAC